MKHDEFASSIVEDICQNMKAVVNCLTSLIASVRPLSVLRKLKAVRLHILSL